MTWASTEETNSGRFEIKHSPAKAGIELLLSIQRRKQGTTNYSYIDRTPVNGSSLYRLKMRDRVAGTPERDHKDEILAYSRMRNIDFSIAAKVTIYPNPVVDRLHIETDGESL